MKSGITSQNYQILAHNFQNISYCLYWKSTELSSGIRCYVDERKEEADMIVTLLYMLTLYVSFLGKGKVNTA
jgi:hypothetical protein